MTLHFCDHAHVHLGRRQPRRRAKEDVVLASSSRHAVGRGRRIQRRPRLVIRAGRRGLSDRGGRRDPRR
jgi:hypothetical protein